MAWQIDLICVTKAGEGSALPGRRVLYALCSMFRTKLTPFRRAMKPIMVGSTTGSRPMISSRTPEIIPLVTTVLRVVVAV